MRQRRKFETLDAGRGVAALAITLHHAAQIAAVHQAGASSLEQKFVGLAIGVSYFFVLSGVVIFLAHGAEMGKPAAALTYLKKRATRIYPVYWIALVLYWVLGQKRRPIAPHVLLDLLTLVRSVHGSFLVFYVTWTLFHEVFFYGIFLVALLNRRMGTWLLAGWMAVAAFTYRPGHLDFGDVISSVQLLFGLGLLLAWMLSSGRRMRQPAFAVGLGGATLIAMMMYAAKLGYVTQTCYLVTGAGSAAIIAGFMELEMRGKVRVPRVLRFWGEASYALYLIHPSGLAVGLSLLVRMERWGITPSYPWRIGVLFVTGVAAGFVFRKLVEVPLMAWIKGRRVDSVSAGTADFAPASERFA